VTFCLEKSDPEILKTRAAWIKKYRLTTQEYGGFTAGCVFQNPRGKSAGQLIDQCGLKGLQYEGAKISERHANFIVNTGNAKAGDVLYLIELIKKKVKEKFGVELREEIVII
jgi:UDP-N-acetylmuramate dehydrogenase